MARKSSSDRLDSVIRIAEDAEKKAFAELAKCREEIQGQEKQLEDLICYREEYYSEAREPISGVTIQAMQNRYSFLQKLEHAIEGQREQISAWGEQEERLRRVWMEKRVRRRALNKASEQRQQLHQRELKRLEQKQMDDLVRPV